MLVPRNYSNHIVLYNTFCVLLMAPYESKLHQFHSHARPQCQSINILLLEGTSHCLFEVYKRSQRAEKCTENVENLAFYKYIESSQFVYDGGSLSL